MRKWGKWLCRIFVSLIGLYVFWGVCPYIFGGSPVRWTEVTKISYPGGIELRRTELHEVFPFLFGPHLAVPLPFHHVDEDYEQIVVVNGRERVRFGHGLTTVYPSPSGKYIVAENRSFTAAPRIYHALSNVEHSWDVESVEKELPGHPYMVTFQFVKWEDDDHFLLEVGGQGFPNCRQAWNVDAKTGSHELSTSTSRPAIRPWG